MTDFEKAMKELQADNIISTDADTTQIPKTTIIDEAADAPKVEVKANPEQVKAFDTTPTMNSQVIVHKFGFEIHVYPNGKIYVKQPWAMGQTLKDMKARKRPSKKATKIEIQTSEIH